MLIQTNEILLINETGLKERTAQCLLRIDNESMNRFQNRGRQIATDGTTFTKVMDAPTHDTPTNDTPNLYIPYGEVLVRVIV